MGKGPWESWGVLLGRWERHQKKPLQEQVQGVCGVLFHQRLGCPEKSELVYIVGESGVGLNDSVTHIVTPGPAPELPGSLLEMESFEPHPGSTEPERGSSWPLSAKV